MKSIKRHSITVRHGAHRRARLHRLSQAIILASGMAGLVSAVSAQVRNPMPVPVARPVVDGDGLAIISNPDALYVLPTDFSSAKKVLVQGGHLRIGSDSDLGPNGAQLVLNAGTVSVLNNISVRGIHLEGGGGVLDTAATGANPLDGSTDVDVHAVTVLGGIDGPGGLTVRGGGTLTLTMPGTYTGGTVVSQGTLEGDTRSLQGDIVNQGRVLFTQAAAGEFKGSLNGDGRLQKAGSGTLLISGSVYQSGGADVLAGRLELSGGKGSQFLFGVLPLVSRQTGSVNADPVTVYAGAELGGGSVMMGDVRVRSGGVLAPSAVAVPAGSRGAAAYKVFGIDGNLTLDAGSSLRAGVAPDGWADGVMVSGMATLVAAGRGADDGVTLDVRAVAGRYPTRGDYTVLSATGGLTGAFSRISLSLPFLDPSVSYDGNKAVLTLTRNNRSYQSAVSGANSQRVAAGLDANANYAAMRPLLDVVDGTAATDVEPLMRQLGGEHLNAAPMAGTMIARAFHNDVGLNARAYAGGGGIGGLFDRVRLAALNTGTASDAVNPMGAYGGESRNVWLRGMAMDGKLAGDAQTAGSTYRATGLVGGVALGLAPGVTAGVAFTAMSGRVSTSGSADSTRIRTPMLAMFAARTDGPLQMSGSLSLGRPNYRSERGVTLAGVGSTATGDRDGTEVGLNLEASYGLRSGLAGLPGELRPFVAVQAQRTRIDGFTESGAGAADLTVSASRLSTSSGTAGLRHAVPLNDGRAAVESRIGLLHEFGSRRASIDANFVDALAGTGFTTEGAALKRNALLLGLGIGGEVAKHWNLFADLSFETRGSGQNTTGVALKLRKQW